MRQRGKRKGNGGEKSGGGRIRGSGEGERKQRRMGKEINRKREKRGKEMMRKRGIEELEKQWR